MTDLPRIALIDDDEAVRDALTLFLGRNRLAPTGFATADAFLADRRSLGPFDCIVADVRMPGTNGLELVRRLVAEGGAPPVVLITGHGDVDMAVAAIKLGAADFIEKPFDETRLLRAILNATRPADAQRPETSRQADLRARYAELSDRQRQVLRLATKGLSNKEIGQQLGISPRTVEIHRAWMMSRMKAQNLVDLVRMEMELGPD
jgi:two-component system response regulator FixJ